MIVETARAKLNLALHVRARRDDGYHEIETLFAFVADGDELRVAEAEVASFTVSGPFASGLAGEGDNLVTRAMTAFADAFGDLPPLAVELVKRLPVASGVGGGSADAAAMLRMLARRTGVARDDRRLAEIAGVLGADVPACLLNETAIGRGRGERLEQIAAPASHPGEDRDAGSGSQLGPGFFWGGIGGTPVLLVNPGVAVSTAAVFARWDGIDRGPLGAGALIDVALAGRNDLEAPALAVAPVIGEVLDLLARQRGVTLSRMSGSGATCFALFETLEDRAAAARAARAAGQWWCLETALA